MFIVLNLQNLIYIWKQLEFTAATNKFLTRRWVPSFHSWWCNSFRSFITVHGCSLTICTSSQISTALFFFNLGSAVTLIFNLSILSMIGNVYALFRNVRHFRIRFGLWKYRNSLSHESEAYQLCSAATLLRAKISLEYCYLRNRQYVNKASTPAKSYQ